MLEKPQLQDKLAQTLGETNAGLETVILSDLDHTLCHEYIYDGAGNYLPAIDPGVIDASKSTNLLIATGRRAESRAINAIWDSGLVSTEQPIIAENGGVLVYNEDNQVKYLDLVFPTQIKKLKCLRSLIETRLEEGTPANQKVVVKLGRTMITARVQDETGSTTEKAHEWLTEEVGKIVDPNPHGFTVVDNRSSIAVQHLDTNKAQGFRKYLNMSGIARNKLFVIGMGDGANDRQVFSEANFGIGFSNVVRSLVDISVRPDQETTAEILRIIGNYNSN